MEHQIKTAWDVAMLVIVAIFIAVQIPAFGVQSWTTAELGVMLSGLGSLAQAGVIAYAAYIGFAQWRKQKLEERRIEAAQTALVLAYEVRNALADIRAPYIPAAELDAAKAQLKEMGVIDASTSEPTVQRLVNVQCTLTRMSYHKEIWKRLWEVLPVTEVVLGPNAEKPLRELMSFRRKIEIAATLYAATGDNTRLKTMQSIPEIEGGLWLDKFESAVGEVIDELKRQLAPLLRAD